MYQNQWDIFCFSLCGLRSEQGVDVFPSHLSATFTRTSSNFWTSSSFADLSLSPSLICDFCPSDQEFAYSFLQIPPHMGTLAVRLYTSSLPRRVRDFHPLERAHGAQTKRCKPRKKACSGAFWRPREDLNLRPHA